MVRPSTRRPFAIWPVLKDTAASAAVG